MRRRRRSYGVSPACRAAARGSVPAKNPCSGKKNSLFSEEQGIECKLLNPLGDPLPKRPNAAAIVRHFLTFPVKFPVLREFAARDAGIGRTTARQGAVA
jgi:hypothetical protein